MGSGAPAEALLLIDFQRAFLDGYWAKHFGLDEVRPIDRAAKRVATLFSSGRLASIPVLSSRCYLEYPDSEPPEVLHVYLAPDSVPWVWKPNTNIMEAEGFPEWLEANLRKGVQTLVIGGCTTTSCVRVSSQAVQRTYGKQ